MLRLEQEKGFTLMEILIVVVIIGILASIAVVSFRNLTERANTDVCLSNQKTIEAARMYSYTNNDSFGVSMAELLPIFQLIGFVGNSSIDDLICPSGGVYSFEEAIPNIVCSIERHNP